MSNQKAPGSPPSAPPDSGSDQSTFRRSDRVTMELPIEIGGSDARGVDFFEPARAVVLSRHGAKIIFRRILSPDQEVTIFCKTTGKETVARVVGQMGDSPDGPFYGVAFLNQETDFWDIDFPELTESEKAAARVLLECAACRSRKVTYLNAPEAEVFALNRRLSFYCSRCVDSTIWRPALAHPSDAPIPEAGAGPAPARVKDERREVRTRIQMTVCLRHPQLGEEIVETVDISRGGFGFKSRKCYAPGTIMEAALPYAVQQANIFAPVRIEHSERLEEEGLFGCGASYLHVHKGWPGS